MFGQKQNGCPVAAYHRAGEDYAEQVGAWLANPHAFFKAFGPEARAFQRRHRSERLRTMTLVAAADELADLRPTCLSLDGRDVSVASWEEAFALAAARLMTANPEAFAAMQRDGLTDWLGAPADGRPIAELLAENAICPTFVSRAEVVQRLQGLFLLCGIRLNEVIVQVDPYTDEAWKARKADIDRRRAADKAFMEGRRAAQKAWAETHGETEPTAFQQPNSRTKGTKKMKAIVFTSVLAVCAVGLARAERLDLPLLEGEHWWGGEDAVGVQMPFTAATDFAADLRTYHAGNQAAPLLLSDKGRFVWCEEPFAFTFKEGRLTVEADAKIESGRPADTLRGAYLHCSQRFFPPSGKTPDLLFVSAPQYNTWIELTYNQNETDILRYAQSMLDNGLPPGVLMIDSTWQAGYGVWRFEASRFRDPKGLCDKLHAMGFKVMFWVCPFVSMDTPEYRQLEKEGGFLLLKTPASKDAPPDDPAPIRWWDGKSAVLDLTHPNAVKWFGGTLARLQREFGVDGFKLDAGDPEYYAGDYRSYRPCTPSGQCEAYAKVGLDFAFNEYRACWKMGGQPLVQRLRDKDHDWKDVPRLITDMIAAGLLGHSFVCPDMIGGGQFTSFLPGSNFDPELFVRSAQVHALAPMMQFSASPWRVLDREKQAIVRRAVATRQAFAPQFVALAKACAKSGEPMLRSLEYAYPGRGYAEVKDEFLMGENLLVAPQLEKGKASRRVVVPPGTWRGDDGAQVIGPATITVSTPLERIPHFVREG